MKELLNDFGVSVAILLGSANSGQASMKSRDVVCDVETAPLKNCKVLTIKLEAKYLFPTSSSGSDVYIYQLLEGLRIRKILAHGIRMQKNPHIGTEIFWVFTHCHGVMRV